MVVITFLWQGIVWANPDIFNSVNMSRDTIQIETLFSLPNNFHRLTIDLLQEAIEKGKRNNEPITINDVKRTLIEYDKWKETHNRNYKWQELSEGQDIVIILDDNKGQTECILRYFSAHPDLEIEKALPHPWIEGTTATKVSPFLYKQSDSRINRELEISKTGKHYETYIKEIDTKRKRISTKIGKLCSKISKDTFLRRARVLFSVARRTEDDNKHEFVSTAKIKGVKGATTVVSRWSRISKYQKEKIHQIVQMYFSLLLLLLILFKVF